MKRVTVIAIAFVALSAFVGTIVFSNALAEETQRTFVGTAKCKICHKKEEVGQQFVIWSESAHAKAYEALASDEAKAVGAKLGIDDPQKADACLKCHVTGHGVAAEHLGAKYAVTDGVGCESCHGAGGDYIKKSTMVAIIKGEIDGATVGLILPDEKVCTQCHNEESPTFKEFKFEEMVKKIAHPIPEARKATYETSGS